VLRALLDQPEAGRQEEAWRWIYRLWGIGARDAQNGCAQALAHGLDCLRGEGGLEQLRRIDRPAIVRVDDRQGAPRWLVLERLQDRQVTLVAGGARTVVDSGKLDGYDIREFVLLWRPPAQTRGMLAAGDRGPGVAWLVRRLGAVGAMAGVTRPDQAYDEAVAEGVRRFQRSRGLKPDGVAGPETLIYHDGDPAPGTPTLAGAG
jgi:general secretion pathway protein A